MTSRRKLVKPALAGIGLLGTIASSEQRAWVREALREHCSEHFPELQAT